MLCGVMCHLQAPVSSKWLTKIKVETNVTVEREKVAWCRVFRLKSISRGPGKNTTLRLRVWCKSLGGPGKGFGRVLKDGAVPPKNIESVELLPFQAQGRGKVKGAGIGTQRESCVGRTLTIPWSHSLSTVTLILLPPSALCRAGEVGAVA